MKIGIFICDSGFIVILYMVYDLKFIDMYDLVSVGSLKNNDKYIEYV